MSPVPTEKPAPKALLIRITSVSKQVMPAPHQAWSFGEGANHFEGELPEPVAKRLVELIAKEQVTVDIVAVDGTVTKWDPPKLPKDDGIQH